MHHDCIQYAMYVYCRKMQHLFVLALEVDRKDYDDFSGLIHTLLIGLVVLLMSRMIKQD
jgi:hypothetical protein